MAIPSSNNDIADCFAESYQAVFNDVGYDKAAASELLKDITDDISGKCVCSTSCGSHVISRYDIMKYVKQMCPGKNDGFDGLSSDYILNAPMSFKKKYYLCYLLICYIIVIPLIYFACRL